ncbi:NUDIX hydrolase [Syntrophorhabdus aromaticivorans]|jgi:predicted NUDIX family NTP pyrophosphohydrolase|uniref:NUDIX hydrolase n=1 Tax=Syntrophorhabdus aromaticivorans TaxID=328301 RepID=UPI0004916AF5|nr:NUDIX hydrolase [Syntrophorhabdus aromaticivorans]
MFSTKIERSCCGEISVMQFLMEEFEIVAYGIFTEDAIRVDYRPGIRARWEYAAQTFIDDAWKTYAQASRKTGVTVYNGNIFRLDGVERTNGCLSLMLSDTDFRSAIGTGTSGFVAAFPRVQRANPFSLSVALVTADGRIVLEKRHRIDSRRRKYHVIAGFMEREFDASDGRPNPFDALKREVREELALSIEDPVYATGLVRAIYGSELCFYSRLSISFNDLLEIKENGETDCEIDTLEEVEDSPSAVASFLAGHTGDFVPSGRACLLLYGREAYGAKWYEDAMKSSPA